MVVVPPPSSKSLALFESYDETTHIGTSFLSRSVQLSELLRSSNSDKVIKDLAILVSQRGVVFFTDQDITIEQQKLLVSRLGELTGKPPSSKLHVHPITEESSELGDEIRVISSERLQKTNAARQDKSSLSA